jgi:Ca-activated chloride channel family protein
MGVGLAHPGILLIVVAVVALVWRWRPRRAAPALRLPTSRFCADLVSTRLSLRNRVVGGFGLAALAFLAIALAGPRVRQVRADSKEGITIALVVDVSASMATPDFSLDGEKVARLAGVQRNFRLLVDGGTTSDGLTFPGRPNDLIALVTFATRPDTACPPTLDHRALMSILDRQKPRTLAADGTSNPGDALVWALAALDKAPTRRKAIVLLTDGESNVGPPALSPRQAAALAAKLKIPIYTIDALDDAEAGEAAPQAHQTLADLATVTGGKSFRATDGSGLLSALHELDTLERDAVSGLDSIVDTDASLPVCLAGFVCWLSWLVGQASIGRGVP